jgi:two-component system, response regulator PdtaR
VPPAAPSRSDGRQSMRRPQPCLAIKTAKGPMEVHSAGADTTILLVEHELVTRAGIAAFLRMAGFHVIEATHTDEVWRMLEALRGVGVLVADLDTADGVDGLRLAQQVHERWPTMGLVITSSRVRHMSPSDVPENGCFLPRPLPADTLLREVQVAASGLPLDRGRSQPSTPDLLRPQVGQHLPVVEDVLLPPAVMPDVLIQTCRQARSAGLYG